MDFERAYMKLVDEIAAVKGDKQPLRDIYVRLHQSIDRLKASEAYLAPHLGLKRDEVVPAAGGTLEPKWGGGRKTWDHKALKSIASEKIIAKHLDPESGTLSVPPAVLMMDMLECVSFSSWKVTTLRKLGISDDTIDRYCEKTPSHMNVVVRQPTQSPIPKDDDESEPGD